MAKYFKGYEDKIEKAVSDIKQYDKELHIAEWMKKFANAQKKCDANENLVGSINYLFNIVSASAAERTGYYQSFTARSFKYRIYEDYMYYCPIKLNIDNVIYYINDYTFIFNGIKSYRDKGCPIYEMCIRDVSKNKEIYNGCKSDYPVLSNEIKQRIIYNLRKILLEPWKEKDDSLLVIEFY